jgi:hypothetical protein
MALATPDSRFLTRAEREEGVCDPPFGIMHGARAGRLGTPIDQLRDLDALRAACAADERLSLPLAVAQLSIGVGSPANVIALR